MYCPPNWIWCLPLMSVRSSAPEYARVLKYPGLLVPPARAGPLVMLRVVTPGMKAVMGIPNSAGVLKVGMNRGFRLRFAVRWALLITVGLIVYVWPIAVD